MNVNFVAILISAIVPLLVGFIWYNPKTFGHAWMKAADITEDKMKSVNMGLIFGLTFLFSFFLAFAVQFMVIHQWSVFSVLANEPGMNNPNSEISLYLKEFMAKHGNNFRTFKHGVLHGTISGFTIALPILGINALFERKGFKYIALNVGFWTLCLALMGGIICAMI
jgi:hypothetical protein